MIKLVSNLGHATWHVGEIKNTTNYTYILEVLFMQL